MPVPPRLRRRLAAALPVLLAVLFAACSTDTYPNSVFTNSTEFNREVGYLFKILFWLGGFVFVFVEGILLYTIFKYRRRSEDDRPEHVHGNTTLEILWTAIPALILAFIAVPTVRTIFKTQAVASATALNVEVIGHQWWWEFRYPQYGFTTANELYLPIGRTVNFSLKSQDVIHSFSIPRLAGKRDLMANRTNYLWFTPDSVGENAWNGFCAEYCGTSHANMHFRVFTVTPANFESWAAHQKTPAAFAAAAPATPLGAAQSPAAAAVNTTTAQRDTTQPGALSKLATRPTVGAGQQGPTTTPPAPAHDMAAMNPANANVQLAGYATFPHDKIPAYVVPQTPLPDDLSFNDALKGDAQRGYELISKTMAGGCIGCHAISGNPVMMGTMGPNLTHVASRSTIAGGIYPNDARHLARWIKNARHMKPGVIMPTLGAGQYDPVTKATLKAGLTDEQIADIVAYLQALK